MESKQYSLDEEWQLWRQLSTENEEDGGAQRSGRGILELMEQKVSLSAKTRRDAGSLGRSALGRPER